MIVLIVAYLFLKTLFSDAVFAGKSGYGKFDQNLVDIKIINTDSFITLPQNYLDRPREYLRNNAASAVLILATMPDFQARTEENNRRFEGVGGHWPVLVLSARTMTIEKAYQSFSYTVERDDLQEKPVPTYGLDRYSIVYRDKSFQDVGPSELYIQGSMSKMELFIVCNDHQRHRTHSCIMFFPVSDIMFKATFPKANISEWKSIRDAIVRVVAVKRQSSQTGD